MLVDLPRRRIEVFGPADAHGQYFHGTPLPLEQVLPGLKLTANAIFAILNVP